jgi:hypothetical protein
MPFDAPRATTNIDFCDWDERISGVEQLYFIIITLWENELIQMSVQSSINQPSDSQ